MGSWETRAIRDAPTGRILTRTGYLWAIEHKRDGIEDELAARWAAGGSLHELHGPPGAHRT